MSVERPHVEIVNRTTLPLTIEVGSPEHYVTVAHLADREAYKADQVLTLASGLRVRFKGQLSDDYEAPPAAADCTPIPRDTPTHAWAALVDLTPRAENWLVRAGFYTLGAVLDGFGPDLMQQRQCGPMTFRDLGCAIARSGYPISLSLPRATVSHRRKLERKATEIERDSPVFEAAADGTRTFAAVGEAFGMTASRVNAACQRERQRRLRVWQAKNLTKQVVDVPISLRTDISRTLLRHLTRHGIQTVREARELRDAGDLDRLDLSYIMRLQLFDAISYRSQVRGPDGT